MRRFVRVTFVTLLPILLAFVSSCGGGEGLPSTCAGHEELCDKRFDEVAFPATHNSFTDTDHDRFSPCQTHDIARQLEDGVRGFMLDTYVDPNVPGNVLTCHALCIGEELDLGAQVATMVAYLEEHRDAIITIIFESYVSDDEAAAEFEQAGAMPYLHAQVLGQPWPTLRTMIETNRRLVVFTDSGGGTETGPYPWYMDQWEYAFQNPYSAESADDFACNTDRGTDGPNSVFIMNHFLTAPLASLELATMVNPYAVLEPHVTECQTEQGRIPNFVTLDFYEVGDLMQVVDELNGF